MLIAHTGLTLLFSQQGGEPDSYQKLRQIYRDIQDGAKAFLAAEYRMCIIFLAVFGFAMVFFVAKTEFGKYFPFPHSASLIAHTRTRRDYYL